MLIMPRGVSPALEARSHDRHPRLSGVGRSADRPAARAASRWWRGCCRAAPGSRGCSRGCCGCGSPPPGQTCGTCSIPDSLFLTDSNGTISFDFDVTHGFWFGCYTLSESDIVTVVASTDIGLITCCQTGDSYIVVAYVGQCVTVGATHEFQVSLCYNTVAYDPTGASDFHCHNLNPPFGPGWLPVCCTSTNPCTGISAVCTYLGGGTCGPTSLPTTQASLTALWSECTPTFTWSKLASTAGTSCVTCTFPQPTSFAVAISS